MATVHIIGGGISGLSAATQLAAAHIPVKLYEATSHAGGRARSSTDETLGVIDHGLHLIRGDAREVFTYLDRIGTGSSLRRVESPLKLPKAPLVDYLECLGALNEPDAPLTARMNDDNNIADQWLPRAARLLFHTPADQLSTASVRRALWRMVRGGHRSLHYYTPQHSLSESFITPALTHIDYHGGSVYFGHALSAMEIDHDQSHLRSLAFARKKIPVMAEDVIILATPPAFTQSLLPGITIPTSTHSSITLHYACAHREPIGHTTAPLDAPVDLIRYHERRLSISIRVADAQWHSDPELLAHRLWRWIQKTHPYLETTAMPDYALWREKRAGHLLTPHQRVNISNLPPRVLLAGDWLEAHRPASLEAAVASGHRAATAAAALLPSFATRQQSPSNRFGR